MPGAITALAAVGKAIAALSAAQLITIGLTVVSMIVARRSMKQPDIDSNRKNMTTVRGGTETQKLVYGEARVGGVMVFADTKDVRQWDDTGKSDLFMVVALCPHHIAAYRNFYINDKDLAYFQDNIQYVNGLVDTKDDRVDIYFHRDVTDPGFLWSGTINGTPYINQTYASFDSIVIAEGFQVTTPTGTYIGANAKSIWNDVTPVDWTVEGDGEPFDQGFDNYDFAVWDSGTKTFSTVIINSSDFDQHEFTDYWYYDELQGGGDYITHVMEPKFDDVTGLWYYPKHNGTDFDTYSRSLDPRKQQANSVPMNFSAFSSTDGVTVIDASINRTHGILDVEFFRGDNNQVVSAYINSHFPTKWTTDHRGVGVAYFSSHIFFDHQQLPNGVPNYSAYIMGKDDLIDPRLVNVNTSLTDKQVLRDEIGRYSINGAMVILDYILSPQGLHADLTEIDWDSFAAAATICDQKVSLVAPVSGTVGTTKLNPIEGESTYITITAHGFTSGNMVNITATDYDKDFPMEVIDVDTILVHGVVTVSGTVTVELFQHRYTIDGTIDTAIEPSGVLETMLIHVGYGLLPRDNGKYKLIVGSYTAPTVTIDEDWIIDEVLVQPRLSRDKLFNGVKGKYVAKHKNWQVTDFEPYSNPTYCQDDNQGVVCDKNDFIYADVEYMFALEPMRCKRLAKLYLEKSRQALVVSIKCNLKAYKLDVGDFVMLSIADLGYVSKEFEVKSWGLNFGPPATVDLVLQETASAVYDFNYGEYTTEDLAVNTYLPQNIWRKWFSGITLTTAAYFNTSGALTEQILVVVNMDSIYDYTNYFNIEIEYRDLYKTNDDWHIASKGTSLRAVIPDVEMSLYVIRVRGSSYGSPPTEWYYDEIETQGVGSLVSEIHYPKPLNASLYFSIVGNEITRLRVRLQWDKTQWVDSAIPEGIAIMYCAEPYANVVTMANNSLEIDGSSVEILTEGTAGVLSSQTASKIHIFNNVDVDIDLTGMWWVSVKRTSGDGIWTKCVQVDWYDSNYIYLSEDLEYIPGVGDTLYYWEVAFHDIRSNKLGVLVDGANYEVIDYSHIDYNEITSKFELANPVRQAENSSPVDATGKELQYYPAPGPGTSIEAITSDAFESVGGDFYEGSREVSILIPNDAQWFSVTCCFYSVTFKEGSPVIIRSPYIPLTYKGEK